MHTVTYEKQHFITRTISSLCTLCECTLSLMLRFTCNYFRKLKHYTFRRFLLSTPVNFLFNTTVIFSPLRKKGFTFPSHKPNIMSGMRFPAFAFNLSPPVTKPGAKISMFSTTRKVSSLIVFHIASSQILSLFLSEVISRLVTLTIVLDHC